jgi:hypothetical protein
MSKPKSNIQNIKDLIYIELKILVKLVYKFADKIDTSIPHFPDRDLLFYEIRDYCIYLTKMHKGSVICDETDFIEKSYTMFDNISIISNRIENIMFDIDNYKIN